MSHKIKTGKRTRISYSNIKEAEFQLDKKNNQVLFLPPNLIEVQKESFKKFIEEGLKEVFDDYSPIESIHKKNGKTRISFVSYEIGFDDKIYSSERKSYRKVTKEQKNMSDHERLEEKISVPRYTEIETREEDATYETPLFLKVRQENFPLIDPTKPPTEDNLTVDPIVEEEQIYFGHIPLMTDRGTFVYNGAERTIVSQLGRSPGVFFDEEIDGKYKLINGRAVPERGVWVELAVASKKNKTEDKHFLYVILDKSHKILATTFLQAIGISRDEILRIFGGHKIIANTLEFENKERVELLERMQSKRGEGLNFDDHWRELSAIQVYNKYRPNQAVTGEGAIKYVNDIFFNKKRYDMGLVGRYKSNKKLSFKSLALDSTLTEDAVAPDTGEVIVKSGTVITAKEAEKLAKAGVTEIFVTNTQITEMGFESKKILSNGFAKIDIHQIFGKKLERLEDFPDVMHVPTLKQILALPAIAPLVGKKDLSSADELKILRRFNERKYDLFGRFFCHTDVLASVNYLLNLSDGIGLIDDRDYLGNRRVRTVGELLQNQVRIGMARIERNLSIKFAQVQSRQLEGGISIQVDPFRSSMREFFGTSELSQFLDSNNPLAEMTHKRRLSALGPGGLTRGRAGFEVRDVHYSHYGRICPIETPEGQNIGLISTLTTYGKINSLGFIETPYKKVKNGKVLDEIKYYSADEEEDLVVAEANEPLDASGNFINERVAGRGKGGIIELFHKDEIDLMDVSPKQVVSVATSLIPFLENDDANRALMGANMQRQAVPLLITDAPVVGTGIEWIVAKDSGVCVAAKNAGTVEYVDSEVIKIKNNEGAVDVYKLIKFSRTNQGTIFHQVPIVENGEKIKEGEIIADGPATSQGELALGKNLLVGFMSFEGYNYEDAVILNEKLVRDDVLTSIHIEKYDINCNITKIGDEEFTNDIPGIDEKKLSKIGPDGIISIGSYVRGGDILVGKVTPKGETEPLPAEKLLLTIFGAKTKAYIDSSLRLPNGGDGIVVGIKKWTDEEGERDLGIDVKEKIRVFVAAKRKIEVGDKIAGRHGNKGIISVVLPEEEMPFLDDGRSLEVMLNPLGVPSRMNIGQILESHLGLIAKEKGIYISTPVFDGVHENDIMDNLNELGLSKTGKLMIRDGRDGEYFSNPITVGCMYILKLHHLVTDKIHARATGATAKITQQPLGGKANRGGQRFGEMEVWALEAYGAAHTLQEMLTIKSDDIRGRDEAYEAITKGLNPSVKNVPESFNVLVNELKSLCFDIVPILEEKIDDDEPEFDLSKTTNPLLQYNEAEKRANKQAQYHSRDYKFAERIRLGIASPETIRGWSKGEVKSMETLNYKTFKPVKDGIFCEAIFGPEKDYECNCGKLKTIRNQGRVCDKCGVMVTKSSVRRAWMGHIDLAVPVAHSWFAKGTSSIIATLLEIKTNKLVKVLDYVAYIVIDPGTSAFEKNEVIASETYHEYQANFPDDAFVAMTGAEVIQKMLADLDLEKTILEIKEELDAKSDKDMLVLQPLIKRLEIATSFLKAGIKPEWMILECIPVIPPDLRPIFKQAGGKLFNGDLNDLYRNVIYKNNRLKNLIKDNAPELLLTTEKRQLQNAINNLMDNQKSDIPYLHNNDRPYKSLADNLRGKKGRFRQNLLGKRVDFSARSVIVVGPELKLHQCGLPKDIALKIFEPFIIAELLSNEYVENIKIAMGLMQNEENIVWDALDKVIQGKTILLNRAPTLHRLGIQAFEPILIEGKAIKLHPLVCTAFNADFDGDQMAVHLPLTIEAQAESRYLMLSINNILAPKDGQPIMVPTQDMVLGCYYLTNDYIEEESVELKDAKRVFYDFDDFDMAFKSRQITVEDVVGIKVKQDENDAGKIVISTAGRFIFNKIIPQDLGFVDRKKDKYGLEIDFVCTKKQLANIVDRCFKKHGPTKTAELLDNLKDYGYHYSTYSAVTFGISDMLVPPEKKDIIKDAEKQVSHIEAEYDDGFLTNEERYEKIIEIWSETTDKVTDALSKRLDKRNNLFIMADSGARGSIGQIRQIGGMRGLMASAKGEIVEVPIKANFREGLSVLEYFISSNGARKGLTDTALRTAESGYLTRRLVDISHSVIVNEEDCGSKDFIIAKDIIVDSAVLETLSERIIGRTSFEKIVDPKTDDIIVKKNEIITDEMAKRIVSAKITEVKLRSTLTCKCKTGICATCYGLNLGSGKKATIGDALGVIAAQSIGEPGTQLTMRTFHTGGVASEQDITQGLPRVEELFEVRTPKNKALIAPFDAEILEVATGKDATKLFLKPTDTKGIVSKLKSKLSDKDHSYSYTYDEEKGARAYELYKTFKFPLVVKKGSVVKKGDRLTLGPIDPKEIMELKGPIEVFDYIIAEIQNTYKMQGVDINDRHIEVILSKMLSKYQIISQGDTNLFPHSICSLYEIEKENKKAIEKGKTPAKFVRKLLGITEGSLEADSFFSAASFQETTRVLTKAAIKSKEDTLDGLKENVIIGRLIPVGTGHRKYKEVDINYGRYEPQITQLRKEAEEESIEI